MSKWDLLAGLSQGANKAFESYYDASEKKKDRKMQLGLLKAEKGLVPKFGPDGEEIEGEYAEDPEYAEKQIKKRKMDALDRGMVTDYEGGDVKYAPGYIAGQAAIKNAQRDPLDEAYKRAQIKKMEQESSNKSLTKGQEAADVAFGKDYVDWTSAGRATTDKNLTRLNAAKETLKAGGGGPGGLSGRLALSSQRKRASV